MRQFRTRSSICLPNRYTPDRSLVLSMSRRRPAAWECSRRQTAQNVKIIEIDPMVVLSEKSATRSSWNFFHAKPIPPE